MQVAIQYASYDIAQLCMQLTIAIDSAEIGHK